MNEQYEYTFISRIGGLFCFTEEDPEQSYIKLFVQSNQVVNKEDIHNFFENCRKMNDKYSIEEEDKYLLTEEYDDLIAREIKGYAKTFVTQLQKNGHSDLYIEVTWNLYGQCFKYKVKTNPKDLF